MYVTGQLSSFRNELTCPASAACVPLKSFSVKRSKMLFLSLHKSILLPGHIHVFVSRKLPMLMYGNTELGLDSAKLRIM
jgi:hypothetical protein